MARLLRGSDLRNQIEAVMRFRGDKSLSPRSMRAYLQYRLYLLEAQINELAEQLEQGSDESGHLWAPRREPLSDAIWASWTSLNYLMSARDALRETIDTLDRGH